LRAGLYETGQVAVDRNKAATPAVSGNARRVPETLCLALRLFRPTVTVQLKNFLNNLSDFSSPSSVRTTDFALPAGLYVFGERQDRVFLELKKFGSLVIRVAYILLI
jgi:hypothetical protein